MFYAGRLLPEGQPLTLSYTCTIFDRKGTPIVYLLLTNGTPFTCIVCNVSSLLTVVKSHNGTINSALSFEDEQITKPRQLALQGPFIDRDDRISLSFQLYTSAGEIPTLLYT